jgi:hypothetical protein
VVRITRRSPQRTAANFASRRRRASPSTFQHDQSLGRAAQDIGQGELRSMNVVQGAERTRLVLNLRRPVAHETKSTAATWS